MSWRKSIFCLGLALLIIVVAGWRHDRFIRGPSYQGASLSRWLRVLANPEPQVRDQARDAIRHIGPAGVPVIAEWLDWHDSKIRWLFIRWIVSGDPRAEVHMLEVKDRRRIALEACDVLGEVAKPIIPRLMTLSTSQHAELDAPYIIARLSGTNEMPAMSTTNKYIRAAIEVSAESLREVSSPLQPKRTAVSEEQDYQRRLSEYHELVVQKVVANPNTGER
jgi:hypothetical protein